MPARLTVLRALARLPASLKSYLLWRIGDAGMALTPEASDAMFDTNFGANAPRVCVPGRVGSNYLFMKAARSMHEQPAIDICVKLLPECGGFVDIGAHLGLFMWQLAKHLRADCPGFFFEPNPDLFALLDDNVSRIGAPFRGFRAAIGNDDGDVDFFLDRTDWSMSTLMESFAPEHDHERTRVKSIRFDTFAREVSLRDALIKADIECAERAVVDGIAASPGSVRYLVCEVLKQAFEDGFVEEVERTLGARAWAITEAGLMPAHRVLRDAPHSRNWLFSLGPISPALKMAP